MRSACVLVTLVVLASSSACNQGSDRCTLYEPVDEPDLSVYADPGTGAWETVAREDLVDECGLDPDVLDEIDGRTGYPTKRFIAKDRRCN